MTNGNDIDERLIADKQVFIFEQHHYALIPWAQLRRALPRPPRLLTFDYHTDTRPAFLRYAARKAGRSSAKCPQIESAIKAEVDVVDFNSEVTVERAVARLSYDEHIDAAVRSGILDLAFVVAYEGNGRIISNEQRDLDAADGPMTSTKDADGTITYRVPRKQYATPPYTYTIPEKRIVVLPKADIKDTDEGFGRPYRDAALSAPFLTDRLQLIDRICSTGGVAPLLSEPFVLDIDLDYFNTKNSISPEDPSVFHDLVRRASIVTIARESSCVQSCPD